MLPYMFGSKKGRGDKNQPDKKEKETSAGIGGILRRQSWSERKRVISKKQQGQEYSRARPLLVARRG